MENMEEMVEEAQGQEPTETAEEHSAEQAETKHEPAEGSPRWNEIYGKMKQGQRDIDEMRMQLAERDNQLRALIEHNQKLAGAIDTVQSKVHKNEMPDPIADPDGYKNWVKEDVEREIEKKYRSTQQEAAPYGQQVHPVQIMEQAVADAFPDYWEAFGEVNKEMQADPQLKSEILMDRNPPLKLYRYWEGRKRSQTQARQNNLDQGFVEGGTTPPQAHKKRELTDSEKKVANMLGLSPEDYLKQAEVIEKRGY
jgi:hypothetical protein